MIWFLGIQHFFQRERYLKGFLQQKFLKGILYFLAFNKDLIPFYIDSTGKNLTQTYNNTFQEYYFLGKRKSMTIFTSKEIANYTKTYFKCREAEGYPLDFSFDYGLKKVHLSQQLMMDSIMTKNFNYLEFKLTYILGLYLNLTGWYKINFDYTVNSKFGKNKGCEYFNYLCQDSISRNFYDEFCDKEGTVNCDFYHNYKSSCQNNGFSNCKVYLPLTNGACNFIDPYFPPLNPKPFEYFASDYPNYKGKCLYDFNNRNPYCLKSSCDFENKKITFYVKSLTFESSYKNNVPDQLSFSFKVGREIMKFYFPNFDNFCHEFKDLTK